MKPNTIVLPARRATLATFLTLAALLVMALLALAQPAQAGPCEKSAKLARKACGFDLKDNRLEARAICAHIANESKRQSCRDDAQEEFEDGKEECDALLGGRLDFCAASGERYYDPSFQRGMFSGRFDDTNPYFLLTPGYEWVYEGDGETIVVQVLPATKRIAGVNCIVVNDVVSEDGELIEDTDDWFAIASSGDVYYCGESSKDYEYFRGDDPREPELVAIDGSFKHGVEGAKAGVIMFADLQVGRAYRQEFALGDAEDAAVILSTNYRYGEDSNLDRGVPRDLAELFCNGDCLVIQEFNLSEPPARRRAAKYYSPGVGVFLEVEGRSVVRLTECNMDPRCDEL